VKGPDEGAAKWAGTCGGWRGAEPGGALPGDAGVPWTTGRPPAWGVPCTSGTFPGGNCPPSRGMAGHGGPGIAFTGASAFVSLSSRLPQPRQKLLLSGLSVPQYLQNMGRLLVAIDFHSSSRNTGWFQNSWNSCNHSSGHSIPESENKHKDFWRRSVKSFVLTGPFWPVYLLQAGSYVEYDYGSGYEVSGPSICYRRTQLNKERV
jgi:hypothetical protein